MKPLKKINHSAGLLLQSLIIGLAILLTMGCNPKKTDVPAVNGPKKEEPKDSGTVKTLTISGNLYNLKIMKDSVDNLLATSTMKKLIFQFFIDKDSLSPTLVAFPAKNKNDFLPTPASPNSKKLVIENSELVFPNQFYFGDQQVLASAIATLIDDNTAHTGKYDFLRFTPKYNAGNKHLYYEISVVPTVAVERSTLPTQPSPPANAN
jgi:hypothetical protein